MFKMPAISAQTRSTTPSNGSEMWLRYSATLFYTSFHPLTV